jgi:putative ABC transport system permease protein
MQAEYPDVYSKGFLDRTGFAMNVTLLRDAIVGGTIARALWLLFAAVGFVLLIAAANVANLFLVRIDARRREAAVRAALGADRSHLAAHYLTESMLVALLAAVLAIGRRRRAAARRARRGTANAPATRRSLARLARQACSASRRRRRSAVVFGLLPLGTSRVDVSLLREGGRGHIGSSARDLARRGLVLSQVALAVVLLSSAALMAKSFAHLRQVRPGFDPVGVTSMSISVPRNRYQSSNDVAVVLAHTDPACRADPGRRQLRARRAVCRSPTRADAAEFSPTSSRRERNAATACR